MLLPTVLLAMQTAAAPAPPVPFGVGERIEYSGKLGFIPGGSAVLSVTGIEAMRGHRSWVFSFVTEVNLAVYRNRSDFRSWTGVDDFVSRQFVKDITENGRNRLETFRIYPDTGIYRRNQNTETKATPDLPLDDVAFFYWVRTIPLELGHSYRFDRYFRDEHNPVIVRVEKRETKEMPDGSRVPVLLLRPVVSRTCCPHTPRVGFPYQNTRAAPVLGVVLGGPGGGSGGNYGRWSPRIVSRIFWAVSGENIRMIE